MSEGPLLRVVDLTVRLRDVPTARPVLDHVSFSIADRECVGLVGESGCGKTVTARSVIGMPPDAMSMTGDIWFRGERLDTGNREFMRRWRVRNVGVVFQDPLAIMDPVRTVGDFMTEVLTAELGVPRETARSQAIDMLAQVGIPDGQQRFSRYPHEFSGGQLQRVGIAAALLVEPTLLIADEPTTALDMTTQARVVAYLDDARRERGLSMLFVTHNLELAMAFCDRVAVIYAGRLVEISSVATMRLGGHHPYTSALLRCRPEPTERRPALHVIPGQPPGLGTSFPGCPFAPRCDRAVPDCLEGPPGLEAVGDGEVACIRPLSPDSSTSGDAL
jgi:peptide/nickel transport system ATP-binding protein